MNLSWINKKYKWEDLTDLQKQSVKENVFVTCDNAWLDSKEIDEIIKNGNNSNIQNIQLNFTEEKMEQQTLKDAAKTYESHSVGNIADLPTVSTDINVEDREGTNEEGKTFSYKVITVDGQNYRVPASVLKSLKAILADNPELKTFKVKKTGAGMATEYTVIPLG